MSFDAGSRSHHSRPSASFNEEFRPDYIAFCNSHRLLLSINMKKFLALFFSIALSAALHAHAAPVANNTPGFIKQAADLGPLDPNSVINVTAWLQLHNEGKLDTLVKEQKQKGSAELSKMDHAGSVQRQLCPDGEGSWFSSKVSDLS